MVRVSLFVSGAAVGGGYCCRPLQFSALEGGVSDGHGKVSEDDSSRTPRIFYWSRTPRIFYWSGHLVFSTGLGHLVFLLVLDTSYFYWSRTPRISTGPGHLVFLRLLLRVTYTCIM
ncbi:hypothetical protein BgiBS90_034538 [Biomphalaria glabrata]|nr:hypothetical protein BgiBS90_034538 [Biomphalaria glabrata]